MNIIEKIQRNGLLMDGAMGSVLISRGLAGNEAAETWNIRHPEIIRQVHADYFNAGLMWSRPIRTAHRGPN